MRLHLLFLSGPRIGEEVTIEPPGGLIGRESAGAVVISDASVSRQHAEVNWVDDGWQLRQLSGRSPTLLDAQPVGSRPVGLRPSGMLKLGAVLAQYWHDAIETTTREKSERDALPALRNLRTLTTTGAEAQLSQMSPIRAESAQEAPPTLIRRPAAASPVPPPPPMTHEEAAPPTMMRVPRVEPRDESSAPPTLVLRSTAQAAVAAQPATKPTPTPPLAEHAPPVLARSGEADLEAFKRQRDELRVERERLDAEVTRLRQENSELCAAKASLQSELALHRVAADVVTAAPQVSASIDASCRQGLTLLAQFGDAFEQASASLASGDVARARALLREASFGIADLRDLFESMSNAKA